MTAAQDISRVALTHFGIHLSSLQVIWTFMNRWWEAEGRELYTGSKGEGGTGGGSASETGSADGLKVLDMAAGSGEATLCLLDWAETGKRSIPTAHSTSSPSPSSSSTSMVTAFLTAAPPPPVSRPAFIPPNVRRPGGGVAGPSGAGPGCRGKLVFGSIEPPSLPEEFDLDIVATDPYTSPAYTTRTSRPCHPLSFSDLANGELPPGLTSIPTPTPTSGDKDGASGPIWDIIICSFALHLLTTPSELFALLYELSGKARWMVIIAPHKKPEVKETWGWSRFDIASWTAAGEAKLYAGGKGGDDEEEETELEIVRDK
ncbi:hypothetical protein I317_04853 [Kwoniella heveanensis CBS 569]|nr:hypothetical protein I317_04853 [Kwoniella heveanensis CBS 569]